ncbi:unnamed protein product [Moneuplotes crassus]|uniref:Uncharacterized protein n=1 Tax=Euplotes crassus TaxID=5936 RepID=A0AAD1XR88_EUPCR|nr:unnamed protein product [Moneuplotes crassus]
MPKRMKASPLGLVGRSKKGVLTPPIKNLDQRISMQLVNKYDLRQPLEFKKILLNLDFTRNETYSFIKEAMKFQKLKIQNLDEVILNNLPKATSKAVVTLLNALGLQDIKKLLFDHYSYQKFKKFDSYLDSFLRIAPQVSEVISLTGFIINKKGFNALFPSCTKVKQLKFTRCTIDSYKIKEKPMKKFDMNTLTFIECGQMRYSNWSEHNEKFEGILKMISKIGIKTSLEKIELCDNGLAIDQMKSMIEKIKLDKIVVEVLDEEMDIYTSFQVTSPNVY